VIMKNDHAW